MKKKKSTIILISTLLLLAMCFPLSVSAKTVRRQYTIAVGQKIELSFKNSAKINWKISDPQLLRISKEKIIGLKPGKSKITGKYKKSNYIFDFKITKDRLVKKYCGKSNGIGFSLYSISKDKVVWRLRNLSNQNLWVHPEYFVLGKQNYYNENTEYKLIVAHTVRTFTFKKNVDFYGNVNMNPKTIGLFWSQY